MMSARSLRARSMALIILWVLPARTPFVVFIWPIAIRMDRLQRRVITDVDRHILNCAIAMLDHRKPVAPLVIDYFVHDVVDKQDSAARRLEQVLGVAWVTNGFDVKTLALVLYGKPGLLVRDLGRDP